MKNDLTITIPKGFHVNYAESTDTKIVCSNDDHSDLSKTWSDFIQNHPYCAGECYFYRNELLHHSSMQKRADINDITFRNDQVATAIKALIKLDYLKAEYNQGWVPDWSDRGSEKYTIYFDGDEICAGASWCGRCFLTFKTREIRNEFLDNFPSIIQEAKMFIE